MISICIKSNKKPILNSIEHLLDTSTLPYIYYSQKKFKNFNNLIIHYKGTNTSVFFHALTTILYNYLIENYEEYFIKKQLKFDYFYFSNQEKKSILKLTMEYLHKPIHVEEKKFAIYKALNEYFSESKTCNIDGFINFRLYSYKTLINEALEHTINDFIIQKEYSEYVTLLRDYIDLQTPQSEDIHLIYNKNQKLLLDNQQNVITNASNSQVYLSDISFSSNDFILNSLISLLPQNLYIHLNTPEDNFITFLKLVFCNKVHICNTCNICSEYFTEKKLSREPSP